METLDFIVERFSVNLKNKPPHNLDISRWDGLPLLFKDLGFKNGAEIGVEEGKYSERLFELIPGLSLYSVDAWKAYGGYRDHVDQELLDKFYETTMNRLSKYDDSTVVCGFSTDVANYIEDGSLDFVYIDANHDFLHCTQDIAAWSPKVRKGGIVAGHDFRRGQRNLDQCSVKDVVQAWAYSHHINPYFVVRKDKSPSWFWVVA
jgi:hypothetical protein